MVIALAGRRMDAADVDKPSFPQKNALQVKQKIMAFLKTSKACTLVCSGANGADLLALEAAGESGMERYLVLPYKYEDFRKISVADRPGNWGEIFDKVYNEVKKEDRTLIMGFKIDDKLAFKKTNIAILDSADKVAMTKNLEKIALIVWDGKAKSPDDATEHFKEEALKRKYTIKEINTLGALTK